MQGWRILRHSISMVINNFSMALRISAPLILAILLSYFLFGEEVFVGDTSLGAEDDYYSNPQASVDSVVASLLQILAALWVAVAWHRYILLEEIPKGILPAFHGRCVLAYLGYGFLLGLMLVVIAGVLGGVGGFMISFGGIGSLLGTILVIAAVIAVVYIAARLYVILPSIAIGQNIGLSAAWESTKGYAGAIILAYVIFIGISIVAGIIVGMISAFTGFIGILLLMALNLVLIMIGMSFLTTIYGVAVEGRELSQ